MVRRLYAEVHIRVLEKLPDEVGSPETSDSGLPTFREPAVGFPSNQFALIILVRRRSDLELEPAVVRAFRARAVRDYTDSAQSRIYRARTENAPAVDAVSVREARSPPTRIERHRSPWFPFLLLRATVYTTKFQLCSCPSLSLPP